MRCDGTCWGSPRRTPASPQPAATGSAADGREDRWSDIDLFFGVAGRVALDAVVADWSEILYGQLGALHHFDLKVPAGIYRAFLLPSCLEVDLGFTSAEQFGPVGPTFRAVFGEAAQASPIPLPDPGHLIGLAWHHVLHARSGIERHQPWQADLDPPAVISTGELTAPAGAAGLAGPRWRSAAVHDIKGQLTHLPDRGGAELEP